MESTTLVAFFFEAPLDVRTVELYGSWDNFANGYFLQHDILKGPGNWTGASCVPRITYDGNQMISSQPQCGPLKQGGRYWYYYKLDDEDEVCDASKPTTTACSLLPGQLLNILDVPVESSQPPSWTIGASDVRSLPYITNNAEYPSKRLKTTHRTTLSRFSCHDTLFEEAAVECTEWNDPDPRLAKIPRLDPTGKLSLKRGRDDPAQIARTLQPGFGSTESARIGLDIPIDRFYVNQDQSNHLDRPSTRHGLHSDALKAPQPQARPSVQMSRYRRSDRVPSLTKDWSVMNISIGVGNPSSAHDFASALSVAPADQNAMSHRPSHCTSIPLASTKHNDEVPDIPDRPSQQSNLPRNHSWSSLNVSPTTPPARYPMHSYFSPSTASDTTLVDHI